jgi:hypothetical protein
VKRDQAFIGALFATIAPSLAEAVGAMSPAQPHEAARPFTHADQRRLEAAQAKRQRKAAKRAASIRSVKDTQPKGQP